MGSKESAQIMNRLHELPPHWSDGITAEHYNKMYPVGIMVQYHSVVTRPEVTLTAKTRAKAWELKDDEKTVMVSVEGKAGGLWIRALSIEGQEPQHPYVQNKLEDLAQRNNIPDLLSKATNLLRGLVIPHHVIGDRCSHCEVDRALIILTESLPNTIELDAERRTALEDIATSVKFVYKDYGEMMTKENRMASSKSKLLYNMDRLQDITPKEPQQ